MHETQLNHWLMHFIFVDEVISIFTQDKREQEKTA